MSIGLWIYTLLVCVHEKSIRGILALWAHIISNVD